MSIPEFTEFVIFAKKKEREEKIYQQWCCRLPSFVDSKYCSFDYYKGLLTGEGIDNRDTEEIIRDIEETHKKAGMTWTYSN